MSKGAAQMFFPLLAAVNSLLKTAHAYECYSLRSVQLVDPRLQVLLLTSCSLLLIIEFRLWLLHDAIFALKVFGGFESLSIAHKVSACPLRDRRHGRLVLWTKERQGEERRSAGEKGCAGCRSKDEVEMRSSQGMSAGNRQRPGLHVGENLQYPRPVPSWVAYRSLLQSLRNER